MDRPGQTARWARRRAGEVGADDFDRHALHKIARAMLLGLIDHAHTALENFPDDVIPEIALD